MVVRRLPGGGGHRAAPGTWRWRTPCRWRWPRCRWCSSGWRRTSPAACVRATGCSPRSSRRRWPAVRVRRRPRLDLPLVDDLLAHAWFALPLTWFMVAGACNAMNMIDGAHGLAGGTALIMFGGIALAAGWSGDARTLAEALAVMGALVGFLAGTTRAARSSWATPARTSSASCTRRSRSSSSRATAASRPGT